MPAERDDPRALALEAAIFARYLDQREALPSRLVERYIAAHATLPGADGGTVDRWLVDVARGGVFRCALADAYARRVRPYGTLRQKLVLTLALLESGSATHAAYDGAVPGGAGRTWLVLLLAGTGWLMRSVVAMLVLAPLHLAAIARSTRPRG